jgi:fermentation-respiration switch protein FrsA (DUF1100 family)|tara:strand:+ start:654 stop:1454 length:801 start_codon:yes stop_codon:yes gene_type:complete
MKHFYILISSVLVIYLILLTLIYINQRKLLYLPSENNYLDDPINFTYNEFFIKVDKNIKIKSWLIEKDLQKYKTILFLHGNAGNLFNRSYKLNRFNELNLNVLIISWRGFSGNPGKPNETNLYGDAKKAVKWLNDRGVKTKNIILYGESLGTGVAVEIGQNNKFNSIILESPYTSMEKTAKIYYPYLPVKFLLKDKYESEKKIKNIKTPILIMHGKKDNIVPFNMGKKLFEIANKPKKFLQIEEDDHMLSFNDGLLLEIKNFINKH